MRKKIVILIASFLLLSPVAFASTLCEPVALLANATAVNVHYKDICKGSLYELVVPKGTTSVRVSLENVRETYCCEGPEVRAILVCEGEGALSENDVVDAGNGIEFYSSDGSSFSGRTFSGAPVSLGDTFHLDPLTGSAVVIYIDSNVPIKRECTLVLRMLSHVDAMQVHMERTSDDNLFDPGTCAGARATGSVVDEGCPASEECRKCSVSENSTISRHMKEHTGTSYSQGSSENTGASTTSFSSTSQVTYTSECHWEYKCEAGGNLEPCPQECRYVLVCSSKPSKPKPSACTTCGGSWVRPPFNFSHSSGGTSTSTYNTYQQRPSSSPRPRWARGFASAKQPLGLSSSSSSSGSSETSYGEGEPISGGVTYQCDSMCISNTSKGKFYTPYQSYSLNDSIPAMIYVPDYPGSVDVYLAVVDPEGNYWIVTISGSVATAYKYQEGAVIQAYARNVSSSLAEWFYLDKMVPMEEGTYTLYMLVVPAGADLSNLEDYVLAYYQFKVEQKTEGGAR